MSDTHDTKVHVTETPDVSYIKNIDVTHEVSDVHVKGIANFLLALMVLTIGVFFLVWGMFRILETRSQEPPRSPMALTNRERLPPEPRLQGAPGFAEGLGKSAKPAAEGGEGPKTQAPASELPKEPMWEIKELRKQWKEVLEHGPADKNGQRYGMPIEKAEEEVLKQLPVRKQPGGQ